MSTRTRAISTLGGLAAAVVAFLLFGPLYSGIIALATLCLAAFGPSTIGSSAFRANTSVDPRAVRHYREAHPGATISEAVSALTRR